MASYTITTTAAQDTALTATKDAANVGNKTPFASNQAYLDFIMGSAFDGYVAQTANPLVVKDRQIAVLQSDKAALQAQLDANAAAVKA